MRFFDRIHAAGNGKKTSSHRDKPKHKGEARIMYNCLPEYSETRSNDALSHAHCLAGALTAPLAE